MRTVIALVAAYSLCACITPPGFTSHMAASYAESARVARDVGDWRTARSDWAKSLGYAEKGEVSSRNIARIYYEYGRASGVICDWPEAERGLTKALEIDRSISAPTGAISSSLVELGRMHFDQKHFADAEQHFSEAYSLLQQLLSPETSDPLAYAVFLEEYATALDRTKKDGQARAMRAKALELRTKFPDSKPRSERTPYGTKCQADKAPT